MTDLVLFQDADFAAQLSDSKYTSGGDRCIFGTHVSRYHG